VSKIKPITFPKTEDNMKEINSIINLNNDVQEIMNDVNFKSDITDLQFQLAKVKENDKNATSPVLYERTDIGETKSPFSIEDMFNDYIEIRDIIRATNQSIMELLKNIPIENGTAKPALLDSVCSLYKSLNNNLKFWKEMNDQWTSKNNKDFKKEPPNIGQQTNTFIFSGDTRELSEIMKRAKNTIEQVEVIDER